MKVRTTQPHEEVPGGEHVWLRKVCQSALCAWNTILTSYGLARRVVEDRIPGDIVECGVYAGAQAAAMAHAARSFGDCYRITHLFDSFQGIPHAGPNDVDNIDGTLFKHARDGALSSTGIAECSLASVVNNMARWQVPSAALAYHAGWFQDTVPSACVGLAQTGIAILRLDGDLYESTRVCMENLFPLITPGGYLIVDDWALKGCRKAVLEGMAAVLPEKEYALSTFHVVPEGGGPVWWQMPLDGLRKLEPETKAKPIAEEAPKMSTRIERMDMTADLLKPDKPSEYGDIPKGSQRK